MGIKSVRDLFPVYVLLPYWSKPKLAKGFFDLIPAWLHARKSTPAPLKLWMRTPYSDWVPDPKFSLAWDIFWRLEAGTVLAVLKGNIKSVTLSEITLSAILLKSIYTPPFHMGIARAALDNDILRPLYQQKGPASELLKTFAFSKGYEQKAKRFYTNWVYYFNFDNGEYNAHDYDLGTGKKIALCYPYTSRLIAKLHRAKSKNEVLKLLRGSIYYLEQEWQGKFTKDKAVTLLEDYFSGSDEQNSLSQRQRYEKGMNLG